MKLRRTLVIIFVIISLSIGSVAIGKIIIEGFVNADSGKIETESLMTNGLGNSWSTHYGHLGEDYLMNRGENVYSIAKGKVVKIFDWPLCGTSDRNARDRGDISAAEYNRRVSATHGWGKVIIVKHEIPDKFPENFSNSKGEAVKIIYSQYGHLGDLFVEENEEVEKGQVIANVGDMTCLWRDHLHVEIKTQAGYEADLIASAGAGFGYSGTDGFAPHRYAAADFVNRNRYLVIKDDIENQQNDQENTHPQQPSSRFASLWSQTVSFFTGLLGEEDNRALAEREDVDVDQEQQEEEQNIEDQEEVPQKEAIEQIYNAQFVQTPIQVGVDDGVARITAQVENTGNTVWERSDISVNVIGGRAPNQKFRHPSWLTDLRPARLEEPTVAPGDIGSFSFLVNVPDLFIEDERVFRLQIVRQEGVRFLRVGNSIQVVSFEKNEEEEPVIEEIVEEDNVNEIFEEEDSFVRRGIDRVEEAVDDTVEKVKDIVQKSKQFVFGGGGSSNNNTVIDTDNEEEIQDEVENTVFRLSITSPTSSPQYVMSTTTLITGSKTEAVSSVSLSSTNAQAKIVSSTTWQYEAELAEGMQTLIFNGYDDQNTLVASTTVSIIRDTTPPTVPSIQILDVDIATPTVRVVWQSEDEATDVASYDVQIQEQGKQWRDIATSTVDTQVGYIGLTKFQEYKFRARARDVLGNTSEWSADDAGSIVFDWPKNIVINEIGWMGTRAGASSDEWIELYNPNDFAIDLNGWRLHVSGDVMDIEMQTSTIAANGYYLIERTDDDTIAGVDADAFFTLQGGVSNEGEDIQLINPDGEIIDQVDASNGWFAGTTDGRYASMARKDHTLPGSVASSWMTYDGLSVQGNPHGANTLYASPRYQNYGYWRLDNSIFDSYAHLVDQGTNTLTLTATNSPYLFDANVSVPVGAGLNIAEGTTFAGMSENSSIVIDGKFTLDGTENAPVVFTSARDVEHIIQNVSRLEDGEAQPGDWSHIHVKPGGIFEANYALLRYAGYPYQADGGFVFGAKHPSHAIANESGTVKLTAVNIIESYRHEKDLTYHASVWSNGTATTTIDSSHLEGVHHVIAHRGDGSLTVKDTVVKNSTSADGAILTKEFFPEIENVAFENNVFDGVGVISGETKKDTRLSQDIPYILGHTLVHEGTTLDIPAGSVVYMGEKANLSVEGSLLVQGSPVQEVQFLPQNPEKYWGSIIVQGGHAVLEHALIQKGDNDDCDDRRGGTLCVINGSLTLRSSTLEDPGQQHSAIFASNSIVTLDNPVVRWTIPKVYATWLRFGVYTKGGQLSISAPRFTSMDYGIYSSGTEIVHADVAINLFTNVTNPWWPGNLFENIAEENNVNPQIQEVDNNEDQVQEDEDINVLEEKAKEEKVEEAVEEQDAGEGEENITEEDRVEENVVEEENVLDEIDEEVDGEIEEDAKEEEEGNVEKEEEI